MRCFRYAVLAMSTTLAVSGSADEHFDLPDGFSLSDPKWFGQDIGDKCRLLQFEDRSFGYVTSVLRAGETLVLEKCHARTDDMPESVENGWADGWFKVTPQSTILIPFEPEGLDRFSVPLACGKKLAYWGIPARGSDREEYFAYVVDVPTKSILKKQSLGTAWLATDWRYYLPFPNWRGDCSEVVFKDDRHFKPVRFIFPGDQESYLTRYWVSDAADLPEGFSLSKPRRMYEETNHMALCSELRFGNSTLGWVARLLRTNDGLLFEKCDYVCHRGEECDYRKSGEECLHGNVYGWFTARPADLDIRRLEGTGSFSNPMACESKVAYWGQRDLPDNETDSEYFAYVADLDSGAVIREALIGQARIATDYRYHLAVPRWRSDCSEVEFDEARYFQPVHFTFSDDGIPAS